jgi:hypothetical protein
MQCGRAMRSSTRPPPGRRRASPSSSDCRARGGISGQDAQRRAAPASGARTVGTRDSRPSRRSQRSVGAMVSRPPTRAGRMDGPGKRGSRRIGRRGRESLPWTTESGPSARAACSSAARSRWETVPWDCWRRSAPGGPVVRSCEAPNRRAGSTSARSSFRKVADRQQSASATRGGLDSRYGRASSVTPEHR